MRDITLLAVGDIAFSKRMEKCITKYGSDYFFKKIKLFLSSGDIIFGNLESPLTNSSIKNSSHYSKLVDDPLLGRRVYLKASPLVIRSLKAANFNILSIANNHILDYGKKGLIDTINYLSKSRIQTVGAGLNLEFARKPTILKIKSKKVGFLAYSYTYEATKNHHGCAPIWRFIIKQDIKSLKKMVDVVVVSFHYGKEFSTLPSFFQKSISHFAIDSGADIVLGHHPHVLQPIEFYKDKIIAYSLGNFLFDPNKYGIFLPKQLLLFTMLSGILKITIQDDNALACSFLPILMDKAFCLKLLPNSPYMEVSLRKRENANLYFQKFFFLLRVLFLSLIKSNKSNVLLLALRSLSELNLI